MSDGPQNNEDVKGFIRNWNPLLRPKLFQLLLWYSLLIFRQLKETFPQIKLGRQKPHYIESEQKCGEKFALCFWSSHLMWMARWWRDFSLEMTTFPGQSHQKSAMLRSTSPSANSSPSVPGSTWTGSDLMVARKYKEPNHQQEI